MTKKEDIDPLYLADTERQSCQHIIRDKLRQVGIQARGKLTSEQRKQYSAEVVERLVRIPDFQKAHVIMIYAHTKAELNLDGLPLHPLAKNKVFAYPVCISKTEMIAAVPNGDGAWKKGKFEISEPSLEQSIIVSPEQLDLVICPCAAFDKHGNRLGMGAGFYDRFLPKCKNAVFYGVAFDAQRTMDIPTEIWDIPMKDIITEINVQP